MTLEQGERRRLIERAAEALDLSELPEPDGKEARPRLEETQTETDVADASAFRPEDVTAPAPAAEIEVQPQQRDAEPRKARRTLPWMRARAKARGKP